MYKNDEICLVGHDLIKIEVQNAKPGADTVVSSDSDEEG
jgi:hypothetical protein